MSGVRNSKKIITCSISRVVMDQLRLLPKTMSQTPHQRKQPQKYPSTQHSHTHQEFRLTSSVKKNNKKTQTILIRNQRTSFHHQLKKL